MSFRYCFTSVGIVKYELGGGRRSRQGRINQYANYAMAWGPPVQGGPPRRRSRRQRRRGIESPKATRGWGLGRGLCPLPSRLGGLGERRELPQRGPGQSPGSFSLFTIFLLISSLKSLKICHFLSGRQGL
jgi:hypothetical protein